VIIAFNPLPSDMWSAREKGEKMDIKDKALLAIEGLTYEDVVMTAEEKLSKIYTFAHVGFGSCQNDHEDWHEELERCLLSLNRLRIISYPFDREKERLKREKLIREMAKRFGIGSINTETGALRL
jgi:hypothetical protein